MTARVVCDASALVAALLDSGRDGVGNHSSRGRQRGCPGAPAVRDRKRDLRLERAGTVSADQAAQAHADLLDLRIELWPYELLATQAWRLRHNLSIYDASYVALAEVLDAELITLDPRIASAPGVACTVRTPSWAWTVRLCGRSAERRHIAATGAPASDHLGVDPDVGGVVLRGGAQDPGVTRPVALRQGRHDALRAIAVIFSATSPIGSVWPTHSPSGEVDPATAVRSVFGPWLDHATPPPEREALVRVLDGVELRRRRADAGRSRERRAGGGLTP